jgi:hypothetical protein
MDVGAGKIPFFKTFHTHPVMRFFTVPHRIFGIPEILHLIFSNISELRKRPLGRLAIVNSRFNALAVPLLWRELPLMKLLCQDYIWRKILGVSPCDHFCKYYLQTFYDYHDI